MIRPELVHKRKFHQLLRAAAVEDTTALGLLWFLWESAYQIASPVVGDADDVERAAHWTGPPGKLARALARTGFLDRREDGTFAVHDFWQWCPEFVHGKAVRLREEAKPKICAQCGATYHNADGRSQYCSVVCRVRRYRRGKAPRVTDCNGQVRNASVTGRDGALRTCYGTVTDLPQSPLHLKTETSENTECVTDALRTVTDYSTDNTNTPLPPKGGERGASRKIKDTSRPQSGCEEPTGFDTFWAAYPRKVARKDAVRAYRSAARSKSAREAILAGLEAWKRSDQWARSDGRFIPYPATFLRGEHWLTPPADLVPEGMPTQKRIEAQLAEREAEQREYQQIQARRAERTRAS